MYELQCCTMNRRRRDEGNILPSPCSVRTSHEHKCIQLYGWCVERGTKHLCALGGDASFSHSRNEKQLVRPTILHHLRLAVGCFVIEMRFPTNKCSPRHAFRLDEEKLMQQNRFPLSRSFWIRGWDSFVTCWVIGSEDWVCMNDEFFTSLRVLLLFHTKEMQ